MQAAMEMSHLFGVGLTTCSSAKSNRCVGNTPIVLATLPYTAAYLSNLAVPYW